MLQPRKGSEEFNLEHNLESALYPDPQVISHGVQSSHSLGTGVNQMTFLLPHIGTVIRFPIGHALYGLFKPLVMIAWDVSRIHADGRGLSSMT